MIKHIAIAATLALLSTASMAADQPYFYAGGDVGTTDLDDFDSESSFGAFAGYQINQNIGVEAGFRRLADFDYFGAKVKADQLALSAVATMPFNNGFSVFGRLGVNRLTAKASFGGFSEKDSENKVLYGAGVGYKFSEVVMGRLEVQKPASDVTNISLGVAFRF